MQTAIIINIFFGILAVIFGVAYIDHPEITIKPFVGTVTFKLSSAFAIAAGWCFGIAMFLWDEMKMRRKKKIKDLIDSL